MKKAHSAIASLLAVCLITQSADPLWANIGRIQVTVKTPSVAGFAAPLAIIAPASSSLSPAMSVGLGSSLIKVETPQVSVSRHAGAPVAREVNAAVSQRATPNTQAIPVLQKRVERLFQAATKDNESLTPASAAGETHTTGQANFARLLGVDHIRPSAEATVLAPSGNQTPPRLTHSISDGETPPDFTPPSPVLKKGTVAKYLLGTGIFKIGMEALGLSAPLLALTMFGSVKIAAVLVVGWGLSQVVFSSLAGGLLDRRSPSKVLAVSMALQALAVTALIGLFAADKFLPGLLGFPLVNPVTLLTLYSLAGGFLGVSDTTRQVIPPELIGSQERAIKIFNAKTHIAYEIAGVVGALLTGLVIAKFGILTALLIHPPAYLLAAYVFWSLQLPKRSASVQALVEKVKDNPVSQAVRDMIAGAKVVLSSSVFRWSTVAIIVPLVTHRLLEGLLIPVTASSLLQNPSAAAWLIGASNFGELLGAIVLMRAILSNKTGQKRFGSSFWVRLMSLGSLGMLALTFTNFIPLWLVLTLIGFQSLTWATSELSLRGKLQTAIPPRMRGRAFAFISAVAFALILSASMGVGVLMDLLPKLTVFYGLDLALIAAVVVLFIAASRISVGKPSSKGFDVSVEPGVKR